MIQDWSLILLDAKVKEELKEAGLRPYAASCLVNQFGFEAVTDLVEIKDE
jgi:hypothetical protein